MATDPTKVGTPSVEGQTGLEGNGSAGITDDVSKEVNDRILKESKAYKTKWQAAEAKALEFEKKLQEIEDSKKQEQGQFKELYEQANQKYQSLQDSLMKRDIKDSVRKAAANAGAVLDPEELMALGKADLLQYDPNTGDVIGAEEFVEELRQRRPVLFQKSASQAVNPAVPGSTQVKKKVLTAADIAKMPADQRIKVLAEMRTKGG